jgi:O-antigen ligase
MRPGVFQSVFFGLWLAIVTSMLFSPYAMLSISIATLLVIAVFDLDIQPLRIRLRPQVVACLTKWRNYPDYLVVCLLLGIVLLSVWQTYDWTYWFIRLQVKASFLVLPLAFLFLPAFSRRLVHHLFYFILLLFTIANGLVLYHFFQDVESALQGLKMGQPLWTPSNHIRYSLLLALAVVGGVQLLRAGHFWRVRAERWLIGALTLLAFIFVHFLAVKSGILMLYVGLGTLLLHYLLTSRRWLMGLGLLTLLVAIPVVGFYAFPTLRNKVIYTIHDFKMYTQGQGDTYSDSGRIAALKAGWEITREHPVLGVGAGNLRHAMAVKFDEQYPNYLEKFMPPNQFLFVWAGTGLWGLAIFVFAFFFPLFYRRHYTDAFFLAFYAMQTVSILIEHSLENIVGIVHYCFFLLVLMKSIPGEADRWADESKDTLLDRAV